ncbi:MULTISPECIES: hypothetical protein [unclassified Coleofasciculus]|nr:MULTISPECIES: hypothetical protein [unclassified Coleofasciculus]
MRSPARTNKAIAPVNWFCLHVGSSAITDDWAILEVELAKVVD